MSVVGVAGGGSGGGSIKNNLTTTIIGHYEEQTCAESKASNVVGDQRKWKRK